MYWEKDPNDLVDHLKIYVAAQIRKAIPDGGFLSRNHMQPIKPWEALLEETARRFEQKKPVKLTIQRAKEIAAENRKSKTD